jgi:hypothetical protein
MKDLAQDTLKLAKDVLGFGTPVPEEFERAANAFDKKAQKLLDGFMDDAKKELKGKLENELKKLDGEGGVRLKNAGEAADDIIERVFESGERIDPQWRGWPSDSFWLNSFYLFTYPMD